MQNANRAFGVSAPSATAAGPSLQASVTNALLPLQRDSAALGSAIASGGLARSDPLTAAIGSVAQDQLSRNYPQGVVQAAGELSGATLNAVQHATQDIMQFPAAAVANTARLPSQIASAASEFNRGNPLPALAQPNPVGAAVTGTLGRVLPTGSLLLGSGPQGPLRAAAESVASAVTAAAGPAGAVAMPTGGPNFIPGLAGPAGMSGPRRLNLPFLDVNIEGAEDETPDGAAESSKASPHAKSPAHAPHAAPAPRAANLNNVLSRAANRAQALEHGRAVPGGAVINPAISKVSGGEPCLCILR
jgi:hypothetical protein